MDDGPGYLTDALIRELSGIIVELERRLEGAISDKDMVAITTAIMKAGIVGADQAAIDTAADLISKGINVTLDKPGGAVDGADLWAEKYGDS